MENIEFEFIDRAISMIKEGYQEDAAKLIYTESYPTMNWKMIIS